MTVEYWPLPGSFVREREGTSLWRRWFAAVTLGGFLGVLLPLTIGVMTADATRAVAAISVASGAAIGGGILGWFQAGVLRSLLPQLRASRWMAVTAAGLTNAAAAVVLSFVYGEQISHWPTVVQMPFAVTAGIILIFSLGVAQWIVLRQFTDRAGLWIWANVVAWIAGLTAFALVVVPLWQLGQSPGWTLATGALGGLTMMVIAAAITGVYLSSVLNGLHLERQ